MEVVVEMGVEANLMAEVVVEGLCTLLEDALKYDACTLLNGALTWWNSHVRTIKIDAVNEMSWKEMMKLMTEAYCPRNEIRLLEGKLWNLTENGTDVVGYTQRFQ
ncbi:reverse transcriptase domain-containing protein [Tanacetum coccineum]